MADMYTKIASSMEWKKPPTGYYLSDVNEKVLWRDPTTGAEMVLMKWPPGPIDKMHKHNGANQWNYIISGKIREENEPVQDAAGVMGYVPKGDTHGGSICVEECLVLFHWDGPRDSEIIK
jgi:quercetin dioxygenase-like cupin family protein